MNPFLVLARKLISRGHTVTFFQGPDLAESVLQSGARFVAFGARRSQAEVNTPDIETQTPVSGAAAIRRDITKLCRDLETDLKELPAAIRHSGVTALLVDEIMLSGPTVAQILHLPYFIISTSVPHAFGWKGLSMPAENDDSRLWLRWFRKMLLEVSVHRIRGPIRWRLDQHRRKAGLGSIRKLRRRFPPLAQITQLPQCLDLPRMDVPDNFYYAGPFVDQVSRPSGDFPWERLDGRPLVYASLGTAQKGRPDIFRFIAQACLELDLQLVIALGGRMDPETLNDLPSHPLVVRFAPQLEILKKAQIIVTHAGLNTVLETLLAGKPMIAIPLAHDQPFVAARLARLNLAEVIPPRHLSTEQIRLALQELLSRPAYRNAAQQMQSRLRSESGLDRAADLIEVALSRFSSHSFNLMSSGEPAAEAERT